MVIINSFRYPESDIRYQKGDVRAVLDKKDLGIGTVYVSEHTLCWQQRDDVGLTIEYPSISLHAISKDTAVYPGECLYIMIDGRITMPGASPEPDVADSEDSDAESNAEVSELLLVPASPSIDNGVVTELYEAIRICQELNPDPIDVDDDSTNEDDNLYEDAEAEMDDEYHSMERGGGDADVEDITRRIRDNFPDIQVNMRNGHEEEEFQDAD